MRVVVARSRPTVVLEEPHDFERFHVQTARALSCQLSQLLARVGHTDGDGAIIWVEELIRLAGRRDDPQWVAGVDVMVAFAKSKGWTVDDPMHGTGLRAHIIFND
ncbi:MAG TPA: hypothetical protein VN959_21685 [Mycobacterium sp.]|nr:hypothetical protein [Mycobacterium sp.]